MKLSSKLSFLILGVIIPVIVVFYLINANMVLKEANLYETRLGYGQGERLKEQMQKHFEIVGASGQDWGAWDDTYSFIQGKRDQFKKENLLDPVVALGALRSDFAIFFRRDGTLVHSVGADFEKKKEIPVPPFLLEELKRITVEFFYKNDKEQKKIQGFLVDSQIALLFSGHVIVHSDYSGEPKGLFFVGRYFDQRFTKSFEELLQSNVKFINVTDSKMKTQYEEILLQVKRDEILLDWKDEDLNIYYLFSDYRSVPGLLAYVSQDRYMNNMLTHVLKNEAFLWTGVAVLLIILFFVGNNHFVLKRIRYFVNIFEKVKGRHDLTMRANGKWGDEFSTLADGFNHMMGALLQKQQQLIHSSKMASIGVLTSGVAHEINNPLFIAKGYIQIIMRKIKKDPNLKPYEESLQQADTALTRIEEIVHTLQQYSKSADSDKEVIRLNHVVEDALVVSKTRMSKVNIQVKTEIPTESLEMEGTFSSVQQIVINLLVNAIEALELVPEDQRFLRVSVAKDTHHLILSIMDSGPGIKPENLKRIYDPFFTTKEVGKGVGLGLFTVHSFVQSLGGEIECQTEFGKGTTFRVLIPKKSV